MPAFGHDLPLWHAEQPPTPALVARALLFLVSVAAVTAQPVSARNWTSQISATRASQLYYEGAMRAADRQIKSTQAGTEADQAQDQEGQAPA